VYLLWVGIGREWVRNFPHSLFKRLKLLLRIRDRSPDAKVYLTSS